MRRVSFVIAAVLVPGGLVLLLAAWLAYRLARTDRGLRAVAALRRRLPSLAALLPPPERAFSVRAKRVPIETGTPLPSTRAG
jgi:hypothetical protein